MKLNEYNDKTKKVIHLLTTTLCDRNCKHCCNKQYDLNDIPYVTDEELKECETLCITGGEPVLYSKPTDIALHYKTKFPNIKNVYLYANAAELFEYLYRGGDLYSIDGVNVSIKSMKDFMVFNRIKDDYFVKTKASNRLYVFDNLVPKDTGNFKVFKRDWQEDFNPANDSIFRKC